MCKAAEQAPAAELAGLKYIMCKAAEEAKLAEWPYQVHHVYAAISSHYY